MAAKLVLRFRCMFDVDDVSKDINRVLLSDPMIGGLVSDAPGLRLPKAFDTFELSVRAIVWAADIS